MVDFDFTRIKQCFTDYYIGLHGNCVNNSQPISGYYIDDLPGLGYSTLAKLTNQEAQQTPDMFLQNKVNFAIREAIADIETELRQYDTFGLQVGLGQTTFGAHTPSWNIPLAVPNGKFGIQISGCLRDKLADIYIPKLEILFRTTGSFTGYIEKGTQTFPFSFDAIAGIPVVVNINFAAEHYCGNNDRAIIKIWIYDPTGLIVTNNNKLNCCGGYGEEFTPIGIDDSGKQYQHGFGIKVDILNRCSYEQMYCALMPYMGQIILYRTGAAIWEEVNLGGRLNGATLRNIEEKTEAKNQYMELYIKRIQAFTQQTEQILRAMRSECIQCKGVKLATLIS